MQHRDGYAYVLAHYQMKSNSVLFHQSDLNSQTKQKYQAGEMPLHNMQTIMEDIHYHIE